MRRVVVTGLGLVTPLGCGVETVWSRLLAGRSGLRRIEHFEVGDLPSKVAGLVPKGDGEGLFRATDFMEAKELRRNDEFIVYGMGAAAEAIADSGISLETEEERERAGVMIGSGIGGLNAIAETTLILEKGGPRRVSPFFIPSALINLASGQVSIRYGLKGPNHAVVTACSTGAHAIGDASRLIQLGDADVMVAGGSAWPASPPREPSPRTSTTRPRKRPAPGTETGTASSWPRVPVPSCSRSTSTPSAAGPRSMPRS
jgi:3-oxoacyl-[acyl-carrier-protein] synthase II